MRGHVLKKVRDGRTRYYVVVELEPDPTTGQRRRKGHGAYDRKKDALAALNEILQRRAEGTYVAPVKQTVGEFVADEWLPAIRATVKPSTWDSYRRNLERHVLPAIGAIRLGDLTPAALNHLYARLIEGDGGRKGLSAKTCRYVHTIIHRALRDATRWGKVARNVAALADPPRPKAGPDMKVWSTNQVRTFLGSTQGDRLHGLYTLALTTGLRRGELLGLRWCDVDLNAGRLSVRQSLVAIGYRVEISEPKTARSGRTMSLDPATVAALRSWRARQAEERLAWGPAWTDSGLVFTREDGTAIHPHSLSQFFERAVKRAGVSPIRLHDTRHTYATLALESGMKPWDVSDRLGHSSVAFTLNVYRHAVQGTQDTAALAAASFILG